MVVCSTFSAGLFFNLYSLPCTSPPLIGRVIGAWGESTSVRDNTSSILFHGSNVLRDEIRFHGRGGLGKNIFRAAMANESDGFINVNSHNYPIESIETSYHEICFDYEYLVKDQELPEEVPLHIIGWEPITDPIGGKYLHHMLVYAFEEESVQEAHCDMRYGDLVYGWANGNSPIHLPSEAGSPLGLLGYKQFKIQYHYNNPSHRGGIKDSSGFRAYYTSRLRRHSVGVLQLGDPTLYLTGSSLGAGLTRHEFTCPKSCTESAFPVDGGGVTVFGEYLHMHGQGVRMVNAQVSGSRGVSREGRVDYYEFKQAGTFSVRQRPFRVRGGDSFRTACYYRGDAGAKFGRGAREEMCIAYYFYYPRRDVPLGFCGVGRAGPLCGAGYSRTAMMDERDLGRVFGVAASDLAESVGTAPSPVPVPRNTTTLPPPRTAQPHRPLGGDQSPEERASLDMKMRLWLCGITCVVVLFICTHFFARKLGWRDRKNQHPRSIDEASLGNILS